MTKKQLSSALAYLEEESPKERLLSRTLVGFRSCEEGLKLYYAFIPDKPTKKNKRRKQ